MKTRLLALMIAALALSFAQAEDKPHDRAIETESKKFAGVELKDLKFTMSEPKKDSKKDSALDEPIRIKWDLRFVVDKPSRPTGYIVLRFTDGSGNRILEESCSFGFPVDKELAWSGTISAKPSVWAKVVKCQYEFMDGDRYRRVGPRSRTQR
ncbi:hypothetical protein DB346_08570 [Verrucomicrobia bacterium LW23]|nr:hypothetical protein DB346_08570 [Verrucomicrobia bacterium LW23]